jgi:hypothetical protein
MILVVIMILVVVMKLIHIQFYLFELTRNRAILEYVAVHLL